MTTESRLGQVEDELAEVTSRLRRLEGEMEVPERRPALDWGQAPARRVAEMDLERLAHPRTSAGGPRGPRGPRSAGELEAVFLGMAVSRGWLDEETRTIVAAALSLLALVGGVWLHERRGRTEAARALVAGAISGLFGTIVVATQAYSLISPALALACGAAVAAVGFGIAVRWRSSIVAAIGSLGALAAPLLVGIHPSGTSIAFVALALAATVAILVWQRWDWLALGAFLVSAPQLIVWVNHERAHLVLTIAVLAGFWLLYAGAALGYELRRRAAEALPASSWLLLLRSSAGLVWPRHGGLR